MEIDFRWLKKLGSLDDNVLKKYCDSKEAVAFCWWIVGDLVDSDDELYDEIRELILRAKSGKSGLWRGNMYWLNFNVEGVSILDPLNNEEFTYSFSEFEAALDGWVDELKKMRGHYPDTHRNDQKKKPRS